MRQFRLGLIVAGLAAALFVGACAAGGSRGVPLAAASDGTRLDVAQRPDNALIVDAAVQLAQPGAAYVEYGNDQLGWLRTPTSPPAATHQIPLLRLRAETAYQARAFVLDAAGSPVRAATADFTTAALSAELKGLSIKSSGQPSTPVTMMDLRSPTRATYWYVALDESDRVVWYYGIPEDLKRSQFVTGGNGMHRLPNGNWLYLQPWFGFEEVTPDARSVRRYELTSPPASRVHHDFLPTPDGRVLFFGEDRRTIDDRANGGPSDLIVRGDTIHQLDLTTGTEQLVWNPFDVLDPLVDRGANRGDLNSDDVSDVPSLDWLHTNSIRFGNQGDVIVSVRHLDQVMSFTPDFQTINWRLGGTTSSFSFPDPADRFWGQHDASQLSNGNLLLFDNGSRRADGDFSRALELSLDFGTMSARKVWEYRHQPDVKAGRVSSATRLVNGNTLINFGFRDGDPSDPLLLVEAAPDGGQVWEQWLAFKKARNTRFRAIPLDSLGGEQPISPTPLGSSGGLRLFQ